MVIALIMILFAIGCKWRDIYLEKNNRAGGGLCENEMAEMPNRSV